MSPRHTAMSFLPPADWGSLESELPSEALAALEAALPGVAEIFTSLRHITSALRNVPITSISNRNLEKLVGFLVAHATALQGVETSWLAEVDRRADRSAKKISRG